MACKICETRRPRRFCPGVSGDICAVCCGTGREVTVNCPLDCIYLQDARRHERLPDLDPATIPNMDIRVKDSFLEENNPLVLFTGRAIYDIAIRIPGAVDFDVREALESLIKTYRTLESGLYYETRPNNPLAANIHVRLQEAIDQFRQRVSQEMGISKVRDADVLGVLVFFQRLEIQHNNGRQRGRAFLDSLRRSVPEFPDAGGPVSPTAGGSPLIVP